MMCHCGIMVHAHSLHPVRAREIINQLAKKLVSSLDVSQTAFVKARSEEQNLLRT